MGVIANLIVRLGADVAPLEKELQKLDKTLKKSGESLKDLGGRLTTGLTLPLAAVGGVAAKAALDFDSAFANVRKTVDATDAQLGVFKQSIRDMAKEIPVAATELADIAAIGGQFGVSARGLMGFTETVARLGVAIDGISTEEAAAGLAQIGTITKTSEAQFANMASTLVDLGNKGSSTEGVILETTKRLAAAGTAAGLSVQQIFGMGAALANIGVEAEAGGTALSKAMRSITSAVADGGKDLSNFAQVAGMSADAFRTAFKADAGAAITAVLEGFGRLNKEGVDLTKVFQALGLEDSRQMAALTGLGLAQGEVTRQMQNANTAFKENTALAEESRKKFETFANQFQLVKNRLMDVAITLGEPILRAIKSLLDGLQPLFGMLEKLVNWFARLPQPVQTAIIAFGALLAAIGPLVYIAGTLISSWGAIAGLLATKLASGLTVAATLAKGFAAALAFITAPLTLTIAGIAAIVLGLRYFTGSWEGVLKVLSLGLLDFKKLGELWDWLKTTTGTLVDAVIGLGRAIAANLSPAFKVLGDIITAVWNSAIAGLIREFASLAAKLAGWYLVTQGQLAFQALSTAIGWVVDVIKKTTEAFGKTSQIVKSDLGPALNWLRDTFAALVTNQIEGIKKVWEWLNKLAAKLKGVIEDMLLLMGMMPTAPGVGAPKQFAPPKAVVPTPGLSPEVQALIDAQTKALTTAPAGAGAGFTAATETAKSELKKQKELLEEAAKVHVDFQNKLTDAALSGTALRLVQIERERQAELAKYQSLGAAADGTREAINAYYNHQIELATGTAGTLIERAREAGIASRADLAETAAAARSLYEQMRESGLFTYAELADAAEKAGEAERRALGINVEAFKASQEGITSVLSHLSKVEDRYDDIRKAGVKYQNALTDATLSGTQRRLVEIERERKAELAKYTGIDEESKKTRAAIDAYYDHQVDLANETAGTIVERMRAAGVQTRDDLKTTAEHFRVQYEQMAASGAFAYEELEAARQRWHDAEVAAAQTWGAGWINAFGQVAQTFNTLSKNMTGKASAMFGAVGSFTGSLQEAASIAKKTGSNWGQMGTVFDSSAKGVDRIAAGAAAVGSVVEGIQGIAAATDKASTGARALGGALAGAKAGAAFGPYGMAIGAAAGLVVGLVRGKPAWAKAADEVGRDFGVKISEGLARTLQDEAKKLYKGDRATAIAANLGKIFKESGEQLGDTKSLDKWTAKTRDLFSFLERGQLAKGKVGEQIDEMFGSLVEGSNRTSQILQKNVKELITLADRAGVEAQSITAYTTQEMGRGLGGLTAFLQNAKVSTQESATAMGAALVAVFDKVAGKEGMVAAIQAVAPAMQALEAQMLEAGFVGTTSFDAIRKLVNFTAEETNTKALVAIEGLNQGLIGLENSGLLTQEMFAGLTAEVTATASAFMVEGQLGAEAMASMKPTLQTIYELQQDFGYEVDESTQKLIDQAKEAGVVGDRFRDANERMANSLEKVSDTLIKIAEKFGVKFPEEVKEGTQKASEAVTDNFQIEEQLRIQAEEARRAMEDELARTQVDEIEIPFRYVPQNEPPVGQSAGDGAAAFSIPALASGGIVTRPTVALIGERGPEMVAPLGGLLGEQRIIINLDGRMIATSTVKRLPRVVRLYGA